MLDVRFQSPAAKHTAGNACGVVGTSRTTFDRWKKPDCPGARGKDLCSESGLYWQELNNRATRTHSGVPITASGGTKLPGSLLLATCWHDRKL